MGFANAQHQYWKPMEILKLALFITIRKTFKIQECSIAGLWIGYREMELSFPVWSHRRYLLILSWINGCQDLSRQSLPPDRYRSMMIGSFLAVESAFYLSSCSLNRVFQWKPWCLQAMQKGQKEGKTDFLIDGFPRNWDNVPAPAKI